jgi:Flp pilus assembly protein TadB
VSFSYLHEEQIRRADRRRNVLAVSILVTIAAAFVGFLLCPLWLKITIGVVFGFLVLSVLSFRFLDEVNKTVRRPRSSRRRRR